MEALEEELLSEEMRYSKVLLVGWCLIVLMERVFLYVGLGR